MNEILFRGIKVFNYITDIECDIILNNFKENDYAIIKNILTDEIKTYLKNNITFNKHNYLNESRQFYREHHDEECSQFINEFQQSIHFFYESILNKKLTKFIGFSMKYNSNSEMKPHYDNYNMPISSTICYYNEDRISYPIYIDKASFNNPYPFRLTVDDAKGIPEENKIKLDLNEGDIVIFRGLYHLHWREKKDIKDYRAILCHTEDYEYQGELISYIHSDNTKATINNVKDIQHFKLVDLNNYKQFRIDYAMYFRK
jgi:hypothetical protein